jgi:hypothetical protein
MVGRRLREKNLTASTVHLWLNGPEIGNFSCQKSFSQATNDSDEIYRRSLKILAQKGKNLPKIRALGVTCSSLSGENYPPLFKEQKRREGLVKSLDKINDRFGENTIFPALITLTRKIN